MEAIIMYRNSFTGGDEWTYYPMKVTISDNCPVCGGKRGIPKPYRFCEDGEWFDVNIWRNECGHVDMYKDCFLEHQKIKESKEIKD